jgi:ABC-type Fe3+/spermidine/putrescine transport system ATPase subunit
VTDERPAHLKIDAVTKVFDGAPAVNDFSLDVGVGEFVSLLGPSGCGKTTLLRMVGGFEYPDRGRILLDGNDVTNVPPHKRPVNMVFQRVTLFPHLNVEENIAFGLRLRRVPKAETVRRVAEALELVRLPGFQDRDVQTLSGGQAQRVALARAIVNRPKVLLFDEPLSALDLQIRRELQVELKDIHREMEGTFVYVTHDQEEAMSMSDRVVVMRLGEIEQAGTPVELYRRPISLFVASFVGISNVLPVTLVSATGRDAVVDLAGVKVRGLSTSSIPAGERASLVLRSEALSLAPTGDGPPPDQASVDALEGTIADVRFVGAVIHYRVDTGRVQLRAIERSEGERVLSEGTRVVVSWRPEEALVLAGVDPGAPPPTAEQPQPERSEA